MLQSADDAPRVLVDGKSLLGPGWKAVDWFDDLEDADEFEEGEEVSAAASHPCLLNVRRSM